MIEFNSIDTFEVSNPEVMRSWIQFVVQAEGYTLGEVNFIFSSDSYLHDLNKRFLNHDTLTDVISFDYTSGKIVSGDIYISIDRVKDNAVEYGVTFDNELARVMVHGVLHYCGYKDKDSEEAKEMRAKENVYLSLLS